MTKKINLLIVLCGIVMSEIILGKMALGIVQAEEKKQPIQKESSVDSKKVKKSVASVLIYPDPFFGGQVTDLSVVTAEFENPVVGVRAEDLIVNGSPATKLTVERDNMGSVLYHFSGFKSPPLGKVEIVLNSGEIKNAKTGTPFARTTAIRYLFDPKADDDGDGLSNELELQIYSDPTKMDTDGDGLPDAYEYTHKCLTVSMDESKDREEYGVIKPGNDDTDNDGISNLKEFQQGTDPCKKD